MEIFNLIELVLRLSIFIITALISNLIIRLDPDIIRSRIYVAYKNLKKYFFFLTFGSALYLVEMLLSVNSTAAGTQHGPMNSMLIVVFQLSVMIFLYHLYVAIRVPDRRIL